MIEQCAVTVTVGCFVSFSDAMYLLCSAWIAEENVWPYVKFKSKFMITQKVPQSFTEAVDAIEEQLKASGGAAVIEEVIIISYFPLMF